MSLCEDIRSRARRLVKQAGTRNPFRLAETLNVEVLCRGGFKSQLGAMCVILDQAFIILNDSLDERLSRMVCAHELGHAVLHKQEAARGALCEFDLFNMATALENEANVFAAEILIDGGEARELLRGGMDVYACASALDVDVNLLMKKLEGMHLRRPLPFEPGRDFMGRLKNQAER